MSQLFVVFKKEITDNLRDRRSLSTALVMPLIGPLMLVAIFFALKTADEKARAPEVPVVGKENAPELVAFLERSNIRVQAPPEDVDEAVRTGTSDVVLRIPPGFGDSLRAGKPALVEILCDPSRQSAAPTLHRVEGLIGAYSSQIGAMRLLVRGVDPGLMSAIRVERVDLAAPDAKKALLLASLPLFLLMACFIGGTYVAIDLTAGERERGTLEPLLLNPVSAQTLVFAKLLATLTFGLLSVVVALAAFAVVIPSIPFEEIGMDLHLAPRVALSYIALFIPTAVFASSLQLFVGTVSKNTKTAQAALGFIILGPVTPGVVVSIFPQQPTWWKCAIPAFGESILSLRILRGEPVEIVHCLINAGSDLVIAFVLVAITAKLFGARMLSS